MRYRRVTYHYTVVTRPERRYHLARFWQGQGSGFALAESTWCPATDVYETRASILIKAELAGIDEEDLEIVLFENAIVVEGIRNISPQEPEGFYHQAEIRQGHFRLEVPVPVNIDSNGVKARYDKGILEISLPKATRK